MLTMCQALFSWNTHISSFIVSEAQRGVPPCWKFPAYKWLATSHCHSVMLPPISLTWLMVSKLKSFSEYTIQTTNIFRIGPLNPYLGNPQKEWLLEIWWTYPSLSIFHGYFFHRSTPLQLKSYFHLRNSQPLKNVVSSLFLKRSRP